MTKNEADEPAVTTIGNSPPVFQGRPFAVQYTTGCDMYASRVCPKDSTKVRVHHLDHFGQQRAG